MEIQENKQNPHKELFLVQEIAREFIRILEMTETKIEN